MKYFFSLIIFFLFWESYGQPITFPVLESQQLFGGVLNDIPRKLILTTDGNLVIGGYRSAANPSNGTDVHIMKIDTTGKILWDKLIEMEGFQELRGITAVEDGGIIFIGVTNSGIDHPESGDPAFQSDGWGGRFDKAGNTLWLKNYGGKEIDIANGIETVGNECFIVGSSFSNDRDVLLNHGGSDIWGFRINLEGEVRFLKTIGGSGNEFAQAIATCANGDYIIAGVTNSEELDGESGNGSPILIRIKPTGSMVWQKTFPAKYGGSFYDLKEDKSGRLIVAGSINKNPDDAQFRFLILDKEGKILEDKTSGTRNDEYFTTVETCRDGGFLLGGYSRFRGAEDAYTKGKEDFIVMKVNKAGNLIWRKTFGGPDYERCTDIIEYAPGRFYLLGEKDNYFTGKQDGNKDFWLVKVREYPCDSALIKPDIFVRADAGNNVVANHPIRFRARYTFAENFKWDFGDGTFSKEEQPLKTYAQPGVYDVMLTISLNETCKQSVTLKEPLSVKEKME